VTKANTHIDDSLVDATIAFGFILLLQVTNLSNYALNTYKSKQKAAKWPLFTSLTLEAIITLLLGL